LFVKYLLKKINIISFAAANLNKIIRYINN